jgi:methionine synthase II (cobalamin-independent)
MFQTFSEKKVSSILRQQNNSVVEHLVRVGLHVMYLPELGFHAFHLQVREGVSSCTVFQI